MTTADKDLLGRLLGGDDLRWLIERMRVRIERRLPLDGSVTLQRATHAQRRAVERLLGRRAGHGDAISVPLPALEAVVARVGAAPDLRSAVEALTGPIADRAADRDARELAWGAAMRQLEALTQARPILEPWLEWVRATGLLRRVAHGDVSVARELTSRLAGVLSRLPAEGMPISILANLAADDGHALDPNTPLSALVLPAIAHLVGIPTGEGAEWRRTVWAEAGVLCGELTNPVLTLNLPGDALTPTGRALQNWSEVGQPVHLTARQLLRHSPRMNGLNGRLVHLCENPTVVAEAANRLGQQCAPLVCTSTHPAAAATILLRVLAEAGAVLLYHGDFDWAGITIANGIIARFGARPWRLDTSAYRRAADSGGQRLRGRPVLATWDRDLGTAMQELGVRVEEERVMAELLNDLIE